MRLGTLRRWFGLAAVAAAAAALLPLPAAHPSGPDEPQAPRRRPAAAQDPRATPVATLRSDGEPATAVDPLRIAVLDFYERSPFGDSPGSLGRTVAAMVAAEYSRSGRYRILPEAELNRVLQRANLARGSMVNIATALRLGRLAAVEYVVFGEVQKFAVERSDRENYTAKVTIEYRVAAVELGRLWREKTIQASSVGDRMADPKEVIERALMRTANEFARDILPTPQGKVALLDLDRDRFVINLGSAHGVRKGNLFQVVRMGREIKDPDTGEVLERERQVIAYGRAEEVSEKTARLVAGEYRKSDFGRVRWRTRVEMLEAIRVGDVVEALASRKVVD